jgi:hypothetical protein
MSCRRQRHGRAEQADLLLQCRRPCDRRYRRRIVSPLSRSKTSGGGVSVDAADPLALVVTAEHLPMNLPLEPSWPRMPCVLGTKHCQKQPRLPTMMSSSRVWHVARPIGRAALFCFSNYSGGIMTKRALITGITGQDGSYLAELLSQRATKFTDLSVGHLRSTRLVWITCTLTLTIRSQAFPPLWRS